METVIVRDPADVEPKAKPQSFIFRDAVYKSVALLRDGQISPQAFLGDIQNWPDGEGTLLSLNGSKDAFGKEVSALGGRLSLVKDGDDIIVSTFSTKPLQGRLELGSDNQLEIIDVRIVGQQPKGLRGRLRVLARLEERVKKGDAQKLLDAFLHTEPPAIVSSLQAV